MLDYHYVSPNDKQKTKEHPPTMPSFPPASSKTTDYTTNTYPYTQCPEKHSLYQGLT
jgi:hypothetical protein